MDRAANTYNRLKLAERLRPHCCELWSPSSREPHGRQPLTLRPGSEPTMASVPSQAFPGEGVRNSRSAPFSLHARGVQLLDTTRLLDGPHQFKSAFHSLRDLLSSFYVFLLIQSWLSLYNILITVASCAFYSFYHLNNSTVAYRLDWTMVAFVIILPMLGFTWLVSYCLASLILVPDASMFSHCSGMKHITCYALVGLEKKRGSPTRPCTGCVAVVTTVPATTLHGRSC